MLVVVAVPAEADALRGGLAAAAGDLGALPVRVVAAGVGPAAAAAATATALAREAPDLVVSAGVGGGLPPVGVGDVVVADAAVAADLGADSPDGFLPLDVLRLGPVRFPGDQAAAAALREGLATRTTTTGTTAPGTTTTGTTAPGTTAPGTTAPGTTAPTAAAQVAAVHGGEVLTVSTATGTARRAADLRAAHPRARAEAMEGTGVATAAAAADVPFLEVRAVSNAVGPRDRDAWDLPAALAALEAVGAALAAMAVRGRR